MGGIRLLTWAAILAALLFAVLPASAQGCYPGDPACRPAPPGSVQVNPNASTGEADLASVPVPGELMPLEAVVPLPLNVVAGPAFDSLAVPVRYQDPSDVSCGVQALGMALDALPGAPPNSAALLGFLRGKGMMYDFGTGVEELAMAAQSFGYRGSSSFYGGDLALLASEIEAGRPVVVSLGANGANAPGHFVTVTGVSPDGQWVSYNDPRLGQVTVSAAEFMSLWGLQGYSGVTVAAEPPTAAPDPYPWVALSAMVMALVSTTPFGRHRLGIGGAIVSGASGGSASPNGPPYAAPAGFRWVSRQVPIYETREVQVGYENVSRTIPRTERRRVQVGWETVQERIPRYRTETYQDGWSVTYDKVPTYRTERYVSGYRTWTERVPEYITVRGRRKLVGYDYVTRREPIYDTRTVFAGWDYREERTPIYKTRSVLDGHDVRTERVPKYEWQDVVIGTETITERVPRMVTQRVQTGTRTEWQLERIPAPQARFDEEEPPTPTPTLMPVPTDTPTPPRTPTSTPTPVVTLTPRPRDPTQPLPGLVCEPDDVYWDDVANWIGSDGRAAAGYLRAGVRAGEVALAATRVDIIEMGPMVRVYGPQGARSALGFNRMTNWIGADNIDDLPLSTARRTTSGLASWGTLAALGVNLVADTSLYSSGEYDRHEYAAALTVDTGTSIASTLIAGAVSGMVAGALVGTTTGAVAIPVVGAVPGAVVGAVAGALVGIIASMAMNAVFTRSGARDYVVGEVADMYRDWTDQ